MTPPAHPTSPISATPASILEFWLGDGMRTGWPADDISQRWFQGSKALDEQIKTRFGADIARAQAGGLQAWEAALESRLALIILLDQFTRNVFRGTAQAFAGDRRAQQLTQQTLKAHEDAGLPWVARVFAYMPLMHAEDAALQAQCVACFSALLEEVPAQIKPRIQGSLKFAHEHQQIIAKFGRFPYRNAALGRMNTPDENVFLQTGPRYGQ